MADAQAQRPLLDHADHEDGIIHDPRSRPAGLMRIDEEHGLDDHHGAQASSGSVSAAAINLAKAILGLGVTALPHAFAILGVAPATVVLLLTAALTFASCMGLARASHRTGQYSYPGLVAFEFGWLGALVMELALLVNCTGMLVAYLVVMRGLVSSAFAELPASGIQAALLAHQQQEPHLRWFSLPASESTTFNSTATVLLDDSVAHENKAVGIASESPFLAGMTASTLGSVDSSRPSVVTCVWLLLVVFVLAPLVSFRRLRAVAGASALGLLSLLTWGLLTMVAVAVAISHGTAQPLQWLPSPEVWQGALWQLLGRAALVLPVLLVALICQYSFHPIISDLQPVTTSRVSVALASAILFCCSLYLLLCCGTLVLFGEDVNKNVLMDITPGTLTPVVGPHLASVMYYCVHGAFLVGIMTSFPLQMWPARYALWRLTAGRTRPFTGVGYYIATYGLLAFVVVMATVCPNIWTALEFIGSSAGMLIAFIIPGLLLMRNSQVGTDGRGSLVVGAFLTGAGALLGVAGTIHALRGA